ncbi:MAG: protein translocase subunit SecD, partial [Gammaproteobacteria bacterium]|nr:protein translocase subunit SecD [Gammaproteobacteria bacterium]
MLNQYPVWKYLLLIVIVAMGLLYAAPNLYGEDPAVQISHRVNLINDDEVQNIKNMLQNLNIEHRSIEMGDGFILIRFNNEDQQLKAASDIKDALQEQDSRYGVALNLAPATPDWLRSMNALPMYLGLDLRGGVHFLMEVDMDAAITKSLNRASSEIRTYLREEKVRYRSVKASKDNLAVRFSSIEERDQGLIKLEEEFRDFNFQITQDERSFYVNMSYSETALISEKTAALTQNISTLKNRVNELGVAEPVI